MAQEIVYKSILTSAKVNQLRDQGVTLDCVNCQHFDPYFGNCTKTWYKPVFFPCWYYKKQISNGRR
jgi:hypothetical protein